MTFPSIRIEGAILSGDLLAKVERDDFPGQKPADFGLPGGTKVKDEIARAWAEAQSLWAIYRRRLDNLTSVDLGTSETRNLWMVPFLGLLGYQLERPERAEVVIDKTYALSHRLPGRDGFPVHIVGPRHGDPSVPPDRSTLDVKAVAGPRMSPHALLQEYLNLTEHLYGLVTNGLSLRLLRDSSRLIKLSYVEFDLERIFTEQLFADFAILFRLLHVTRLPASREHAAQCLLERYHQDALESGARIRDGLRDAVEKAIVALGNGFLAHRENEALRSARESGTLSAKDYYGHLLRLIYRLLFLMVIEERGLVYPRSADRRLKSIYDQHYSLARLRRLAGHRFLADKNHSDLWLALRGNFRLFEDDGHGDKLGLSPLAGSLFSSGALGPLNPAQLDNATLLGCLRELSLFEQPDTHQVIRVNYGALATEEFGSVYESLLELHPVFLDGTPSRFTFKQAAGNERKTTGSYYTPSSLVECLLDSALDPVVEQRLAGKKGADAEQAILSLKVCDPAVGSGHFLIAAGHRLARRLATLRSGDDEPSPDQLRHALREVISHCLYGVDVNPMSVELCKVTLWLEATEPGKPLSFLDHHIQCGNSLLGATPRVLADGLPDDAFKPIEGDDKTVCAEAKKRNKSERQQLALFHGTETAPWQHLGNLPAAMLAVGTMSDDTAAALHRKEQRYAELIRSTGYLGSRFLADAWCAAFVWKKTRDLPYPITNDVLRKIERNPHDCAPWMREEIERLRDRHQFFHWHLAFPEVFPVPEKGERAANEHAGWNGGFDVLLGNPPWDKVELMEKEWFAERVPEIAQANTGAKRKNLIAALKAEQPTIYQAFLDASRHADGERHFIQSSERYPLCGHGRINTYATFAETNRILVNPNGQVGCILPSGIGTDESTKEFFCDIVVSESLRSFFDFENKRLLFSAVAPVVRFCLLTITGTRNKTKEGAEFAFYCLGVECLLEAGRKFRLSAEDIALINPNTNTCPIFRTEREAQVSKQIYRKAPVLIRHTPDANPWSISLKQGLFNMTSDSGSFVAKEQLLSKGCSLRGSSYVVGDDIFLPLYEAKLVQQFDHRRGTFSGLDGEAIFRTKAATISPNEVEKASPDYVTIPRYWVNQALVREASPSFWTRSWFIVFRDIIQAMTNARCAVFTVIPTYAVSNKLPILFPRRDDHREAAVLLASLNSFVFDFCTRQKIGGTSLNFYILEQLPVLPPATYAEPCAWAGQPAVTHRDWLLPRVLELTYTAWDLEPFARDCGWFGPPFVWDEARRFQLRCELDAAFLHLYGLSHADAAYILDTFPIVRRKDEAAHGTYRTRDTILALYDQFAEASTSGKPFVSPLDPPPGDIRACHPARPVSLAKP